ncbi:MAG: DNA-binding response regulator [Nocardioidaceae bacterium]
MPTPIGPAPLSVLGLSADQEALYRVLLRNPGLDRTALQALVEVEPDGFAEDLARLTGLGLAHSSDGRVRALPPDEALTRLISQETQRLSSLSEQLAAVRGLVPVLAAEHLVAGAPAGEPVPVELIGRDAVAPVLQSLLVGSTGDLLWLRPDQWRAPAGSELDSFVVDQIRSGRRSRAIYPATALESSPETIRARGQAGEHVRILAEVPFGLTVLVGAGALLPEALPASQGRRVLVRHRAVVGAMEALFDLLWDRALPVPGLGGEGAHGRAGERRLLVDQLAGGAKDEQIARALGLSLRTVRRRVARLVKELDVDSRFQAGVEAVRRGWV